MSWRRWQWDIIGNPKDRTEGITVFCFTLYYKESLKGKLDKHLPVELACDYRKLLLMKQTSGLHWKVIATSGLVVECMCWMWKVMKGNVGSSLRPRHEAHKMLEPDVCCGNGRLTGLQRRISYYFKELKKRSQDYLSKNERNIHRKRAQTLSKN